MVLRALDRTLTHREATLLRDRIYAALHRGAPASGRRPPKARTGNPRGRPNVILCERETISAKGEPSMEALVLLALLGVLIVVPLLILKVLLQVVFGLVLLPFKLLGGMFRLVFLLVGGFFKLLFTGALAVGALLLGLGALILLPLLPFLVLGGLVWLAVRASRPVVRRPPTLSLPT
jgi:hypothetical protein